MIAIVENTDVSAIDLSWTGWATGFWLGLGGGELDMLLLPFDIYSLSLLKFSNTSLAFSSVIVSWISLEGTNLK